MKCDAMSHFIIKKSYLKFEPDYLFRLRISVSGETFEPNHLFQLRISVSGETFDFQTINLSVADGKRAIFSNQSFISRQWWANDIYI